MTRYENSHHGATVPLLILLVSMYSWVLMIGIHVFDWFVAANQPLGMKYYITLGMALSSSLYTTLHGRHVVRNHFGPAGGRNLVLTPWQAFLVATFVISLSAYGAWIVGR